MGLQMNTLTVNGRMVTSGPNDPFWHDYARGTWEPDTRAAFQRFIRSDRAYIDIGAWIGPTLLIGAPLAKHAYGVEPDPVAFRELSANIAANPDLAPRVTLSNVCIAPQSGPIAFGSRGAGGDSMSSLLFQDGQTHWTVDGLTFDDWMAAHHASDCAFIKIDIEGGEFGVVPTMLGFLRSRKPSMHLSLHPGFVGDLHAATVTARLRRAWLRVRSTHKLLNSLAFYRHWYDPYGRVPPVAGAALKSKINQRLSRGGKIRVRLMACFRAALGKNSAIVLTEERW